MKNKPHTQDDIYNQLLHLIRSKKSRGEKLPSEEVLAADFGVSRVKIRDVLSVLEFQGFVNRRKGVGTMVNSCLGNEPARLDIDNIYEETVAESGFSARTLVQRLQYLQNTPENVAKPLEIAPTEPCYVIEKIIFADERPCIFLKDYILPKYYNHSSIDLCLLAKSTFSFIENYLQGSLESIVVHLDAEAADEEVANKMEFPCGSPILRLDSMCYNFYSEPVMYSIEYHNTKILPYSIYKRFHRTRYFIKSNL